MLFMSICDNAMVLKVLSFIKILLDAVLFIVPMGLIVMIILDFFKNVIASKDDDMKKNTTLVFKRLIYAVILFLVPAIVEFVFVDFLGESLEFANCFNIDDFSVENTVLKEKAKCVGEDVWWSEVTYSCNKKDVASDFDSDSDGGTSKKMYGNSSYDVKEKFVNYEQGSSKWQSQKFCKSGYTMSDNGCGPTSLAMIASGLTGKKITPSMVAKDICEIRSNPNHEKKNGGAWLSELKHKKLMNKYGLKAEVLFKLSDTHTKAGVKKNSDGKYVFSDRYKKWADLIFEAVKQGKGVLLHVPGHYVAVGPHSKCASDQVYYYDPSSSSKDGCYTKIGLFDRSVNHASRCANEGNCGWKRAVAYSIK